MDQKQNIHMLLTYNKPIQDSLSPFQSDKDRSMSQELSSSAQKVQDALHRLGYSSTVVELPDSTRTAREAAQAIGCQVAQIVKSLVFRGKHSHKPILVVASGSNRVNEQRLSALVGE